MKSSIKYLTLFLTLLGTLIVISCKDDDEKPKTEEKIYSMAAVANSGVSGNVTFRKQGTTSTLIVIQLQGTQGGNTHPAHIHANSVAQGGSIVIHLTPVDGSTGRSETVVTAFADGNNVTYEQLINYNGHANVHLSQQNLATLIAQGNIGSNSPSASSPSNGGGY